jgi:hypothetical protein
MQAPQFQAYYPSIASMSSKQRAFYRHLTDCIERQQYPPINGNISYLFVYVYDVLQNWHKDGYGGVYSQLLDIAEAYYQETKFAQYCRRWSYDCLLGLEQYDEFLSLSEPEDIFSVETQFSNERCNVCYHIGIHASPVDLLKMSGAKITGYTRKHSTAFRDFLQATFEEDAKKNGPWLDRLLKAQKPRQTYYHTLFQGAPIHQPEPKFQCYCFYAAYDYLDVVGEKIREAENRLRDAHQIARVGEGWISETALFHTIKIAFPQTRVIQHGKPEWLGRQHFDIWLPRWKIAVEYHGTQHFEPVEIFGGTRGLAATKERDARKEKLCKVNGVKLIVVTEGVPHEEVVDLIRAARFSRAN